MNPSSFPRVARTFSGLVFSLALAGCFGTGDGPESIPGTPAPPPDPTEQCDPLAVDPDGSPFPLFFERDGANYNFGMDAGFGGGATVVVANPVCRPANATPQVARMQKFAAEIFGGSTLALSQDVDFSQGEVFTMQVWSERSVPVTFKFEDATTAPGQGGIEVIETHTGNGGEWQTLCFEFDGVVTPGYQTNALTLIFDATVLGNADNDPDNWTFYMDAIEQTDVCPGAPTTTLPVDFEDDPATYQFGDFEGGTANVIANPDQSGINTTAQTARMIKDGGAIFGGSTLALADDVDFTQGSAFRMKVWSNRGSAVPVLFKLDDAASTVAGAGIENEQTHTGGGTWEELCFDFGAATSGFVSDSITFIFDQTVVGDASNDPDAWTFYFDEIEQVADCSGGGTPPPAAFATLTFDDPAVTYTLEDFGGNASSIVNDPTGGTNQVMQAVRSDSAQDFAGTTISTLPGSQIPQPIDANNLVMTARVYSPVAGVTVKLKIEDSSDPTVSVEVDTVTTVADAWETLTFDFSNTAGAAFDAASTYNKLSIFFNFGATGVGEQTYFVDDIGLAGGGGGAAGPIDFESGAMFSDFGGGEATVIANPDPSGINTSSQVGEMRKNAGAIFGGSTLQLTSPVDLAQTDNYLMKVRAQREVVVTLKIEPQAVERTATYSGSGDWEELCFDFSDVAATGVTGITLIFDNGVAGDAGNPDPAIANDWIFQFDDIQQTTNACPAPPGPTFETITFDDPAITYTLTDFGGNASTITNDPEGGSNQVVQAVRSDTAATFAGTTVSTLAGDEIPVLPLDNSNLLMTVRVYSPEAGVTVRLKIEDASDAAIFVETDTTTTAVNTWETLTFDFGNPASQAFNEANTYNRITIFFNFGVDGATAGVQNYFFDDIAVAPPPPTFETLTFDDPAVTYTLEDFGGNASSIVNDPTGGTNQVMQAVRGAAAQDFAGTTISTLPGSEIIQPIDANNLVMSARVYSPVAGVTVKLKIEDSSNAGISVEVDTPTTVADAWETLTFDFSNTVGAAFDPANTYNKLSIFFNFGATGVGEQTYFVDDIAVGAGGGGAVGGELAVNGGFEAGDLSGWTIFDTNNNGGSGSVTIEGTEVSEGSFSVRAVAAEGQNPTLKQEFLAAGTVTPGQTVNISFDMKGTAGAGGVIFPELISEGDMGSSGELLETIAVPTAGFTTYSYTPTAGADLTRGITFQIAVVCGGVSGCFADVFIDNVSITLD